METLITLDVWPGSGHAQQYRLVASLDGHRGAVNTLAFNTTQVASGGDDEEVRIWDLKTYKNFQTLTDGKQRWGQITAIRFVGRDATHTGMEWLCFGTGRGQFLVYHRTRKSSEFTEHIHQEVFGPGDSVESFDFDSSGQRFAITSHYGRLQVIRVENTQLTKLWDDKFLEVIPRAVSLADQGASVIVYVMETGIICCKDTETAAEKYSRPLKSAIGNINVCPSTGSLLIDNMTTGFDLYSANRPTPIRTFKIDAHRRFVKAGVFAEMGRAVVCGSDHGKVYVFGIDDGKPCQILKHGTAEQMIQAVEATSTQNHHIIATGTSTGKYNIHIWKKTVPELTQRPRTKREDPNHPNHWQHLVNIVFLLLIAFMTSNTWLPTVEKHYKALTSRISSELETVRTHKPQHNALDSPVNLMDVFHSLDDNTLRRVFKMGSLTESELHDIAESASAARQIASSVSPQSLLSPTCTPSSQQPEKDPAPPTFPSTPSSHEAGKGTCSL